jgi:hypothetical protein
MNKGVYISFTRGARMSVTGEGGQNKIFGAVINHIKKWVDKNKPQEIYFSAFKPRTGAFGSQDDTRSGLYRKMVQRFASQNGYDYDVEDTGNEDTFILKRKENDTQTNEDFDNISDIDLKNALDTMAKNAVNGERLKDVFIMRNEHNMTFKQIGGEIGTGIDRARQVYLRSLRHLRKILQDYKSPY